jgi:hypothetical protein
MGFSLKYKARALKQLHSRDNSNQGPKLGSNLDIRMLPYSFLHMNQHLTGFEKKIVHMRANL